MKANPNLSIIFSKTNKDVTVDYGLKSTIRQAISATLKEENFAYDAEVSVTLCDNNHIRKINKKYRNLDKPTDVLSFPMYEEGEAVPFSDDEAIMLGDIVISLERAREQAEELSNTFLREVAFLSVHSTLHLLGYDHERSEQDDKLQCQRQREIIETMDFKKQD